MTDRDPDYGHDCGPDCACFDERFAELRQDVRDFPTGEISVDAQEIARLLAAYDDALYGRKLARLDTENEIRLYRQEIESLHAEARDAGVELSRPVPLYGRGDS